MPKFRLSRLFFWVIALLAFSFGNAQALDAEQQEKFDRILAMSMADLTRHSQELLAEKYPEEDWEPYDFPAFVYTSDSVEAGYKIAVKEPQLLGDVNSSDKQVIIPCYCFCQAMGHKNLLHCFWKKGRVGEEFDDHAANCNICYGQAMLAFLWHDLGTSHDEIIAGMEKKFARLIKLHEEGKL
ncbi:MAG TPA: PCYCGC motif-containing (lipo)protein [Desulfuromonadales bacterium]|nr:PCYCGC motif-containing (lipo)protein [Desulfuromonadales bacterium]